MTSAGDDTPRTFELPLTGRGPGSVGGIDLGPAERPVDLVFLHANGFNALTYRHLLTPLAERWRILAIDQRGHGATTLPADPAGRAGWQDLRDDLLALLEALDLRGVVLSGHSMGGTVSVLAAALAPERARALVLLDPVMFPRTHGPAGEPSPMVAAALRRRSVFADRAAALAAYRGRGAFATWPEEMLEDYVAAGLVDQPGGEVALACTPQWEASNYAAQGHDSWGAVERYPGPVTVLAAEMGSTFRPPEGPALDVLAPRMRMERLAGATHFLPMEQPERVRQALADALSP